MSTVIKSLIYILKFNGLLIEWERAEKWIQHLRVKEDPSKMFFYFAVQLHETQNQIKNQIKSSDKTENQTGKSSFSKWGKIEVKKQIDNENKEEITMYFLVNRWESWQIITIQTKNMRVNLERNQKNYGKHIDSMDIWIHHRLFAYFLEIKQNKTTESVFYREKS